MEWFCLLSLLSPKFDARIQFKFAAFEEKQNQANNQLSVDLKKRMKSERTDIQTSKIHAIKWERINFLAFMESHSA